MQAVWREIERAPASAAAIVWKKCFGADFDAVAAAMLRKTSRQASSIPCPDRCGCGHRVVPNGRTFVGVCDCEDESCDDLTLTAEDITVWELSRDRLGRAIARALGCDPHLVPFAPNAIQVASFGAASLQVMLVSANEPEQFQAAVTDLVARLDQHFIVLAPTRRFFNSAVQELISRAKAGFIALESHLRLVSSGAFQSDKTAGELFSPYLRCPEESADEGEAQRVFSILMKLKSKKAGQKAPLYDVFIHTVGEGLSQKETAKRCKCSAALISDRVKAMEREFKLPVEKLRAFAKPVSDMEASVKGRHTRPRDDSS